MFHLVGAVEGTFQEMNSAFGLDLDPGAVKLPALVKAAKTIAGLGATLELYLSERDRPAGWLSLLYELRNWGAHRRYTGRVVYVGGVTTPPNSFVDPRTGTAIPGGTADVLARFETEARTIVERIRATYP